MGRAPSFRTAGLSGVESAVEAIRAGGMVIVVDDPDRENEGDLVMAAELATPEAINFMATHGRGLVCAPMLTERLDQLAIPPMVAHSTDPKGTAFHVGVDLRARATTGISATDRASTVRALADPTSVASDFTQPGHVFPLAYREGGVFARRGHTEAAIDLAMLAGVHPAAVICEIAREDGEMMRLPELLAFAAHHGLPVVAISDMVDCLTRAARVARVSQASIPLEQADFTVVGYRDELDGREHLAAVLGDVRDRPGVLVRLHSECLTGDVLGSRRCDCGHQLELALETIAKEGAGVLVYLRGHEGRGIGLLEKLNAYTLQDRGLDTVEANIWLGHAPDLRDYGVGAQILADLGVDRPRLLTNNPAKRSALERFGVSVVDSVPLLTVPTAENIRYLDTKRTKMGHVLDADRSAVPTPPGR